MLNLFINLNSIRAKYGLDTEQICVHGSDSTKSLQVNNFTREFFIGKDNIPFLKICVNRINSMEDILCTILKLILVFS